MLATRRGKQFNSLIHGKTDPLTGAQRDAIFMSRDDVVRLGLRDGAAILLRNEQGEFHGHVKIDRIKPGCVQGHWPEVNVLVPAGCLDPSGVPDYNAIVEIIPVNQLGSVVMTAATAKV
jgi:anaerobic selenocysteine-containing dehydrogenase